MHFMIKRCIRAILPTPFLTYLRGIQASRSELSSNPQKERLGGKKASLDFDGIYQHNGFDGTESRSGGGSTLEQTYVISRAIPLLLKELAVKYFLDVPCGDMNWMRYVELGDVKYTGGDIVQTIVDKNAVEYGDEKRSFQIINIITGPLPVADMIFCRDCLVHLSYADGLSALEQFRNSGAKWLLTTTFTDRASNSDLYEGDIWRPLNLEQAPYNLPKPERYINEACTEGGGLFGDKCLALWRIDE